MFFFVFYFVYYYLAPSSVPDPHRRKSTLALYMHNIFLLLFGLCVEINEKNGAHIRFEFSFFYSTINKGMKITHGDATPGSKMKTKTYLYIFVRSFIRILSLGYLFYVLCVIYLPLCVYTVHTFCVYETLCGDFLLFHR